MKTMLATVAVFAFATSAALADDVPCPIGVPVAVCDAHNAYRATLPAWVATHPDRSSLPILFEEIRTAQTDVGPN